MFKFILTAFILLAYLLRSGKKKLSFITPSVFVISLYFVSVSLSLPHILVNNDRLSLNSEYFPAAIVFILLLFLYLFPFVNIREDKVKKIILPNSNILYLFSWGIVVLSLLSIFYFTPTVVRIFSLNDLNFARQQMLRGEGYTEESLINTIASVSASFYTIALFLFFIYRAKGTNKKLSILLLISSVSYVLNVFAYVGRDGVVFWIFSFIGTYGLFHNFLPRTEKKNMKRVLTLFLILAIPLFMGITYDRFSDNPFAGILSYAGQSFPNFCLWYEADYPVSNGAAFPLFREILGLPIAEAESGEYGGTFSWFFGTFLKSFMANFGIIGTIILGVFMGLIIFVSFKRNCTYMGFNQLFLYFLYFQIYSQGVFYFRQYTRGGNLFIILSIIFYIIFSFSRRFDNRQVVLNAIE